MTNILQIARRKKDRLLQLTRHYLDTIFLKRLRSGTYRVRDHVIYYCQFASPDLAKDILEKKIPAAKDPKWEEFGFLNPEEYDFWAWRACAIVCMKMVIDTLRKNNESVKELIEKGIKKGGYLTHDKDGNFIDKGWYYVPLLKMAKEYNINGKLFPYMSYISVCGEISRGHFFIASVNPEIIRFDKKEVEKNTGGHLVLVHGFKWTNGKCDGFYIHNPSGKKTDTQNNAFIPIDVFEKAFALRGFSLWI